MSIAEPPSIEHLRLRSFVLIETLAETGSLHQAARRMNISQPALTVMLRELERSLGGVLFERTTRGLRLTGIGAHAVRQASLTMADLRRLQREVGLSSTGQTLLRVGALPLFMLEIVPAALSRLRASHPAVRIEFREDAAPELLQALCSGALDLVLGRMTPEFSQHADLEQQQLFTESFCVIASREHPLARRRDTSWQVLHQASWVEAPRNTLLREQFAEVFLSRGLQPPMPAYVSASFHSCIAIIQAADCLMLVPSEVGRHFGRRDDIVVLDVEVGQISGTLSAIRRKGLAETEGRAIFETAVRAILAERRPVNGPDRGRKRRSARKA